MGHGTAIGLLWIAVQVAAVATGARLQPAHISQPAAGPTVLINSSSSASEAVLLSSLSTFTTSGTGYLYVQSPSYLQLQQWWQPGPSSAWSTTLNSSSSSNSSGEIAPRREEFAPTPPHKPLWPTWSHRDCLLFGLAAVTLFIAAGGGIGGGAVFVPLYIIVGEFTAAQAVALSNITILGGAVANFIANSSKRHAFRDTPLIDWDLILVMEPTTMLGALLGSYANKLFPSWFTSCLMAGLLVFLTWKLLRRAVTTFIHESNEFFLQRMQQQQQQQQPRQALSDDLNAPLLEHDGFDQDAAEYAAEDAAAAADGHAADVRSTNKHRAEAAGAWMDSGAAGDQCAAATGLHHTAADRHIASSVDASVVPVPEGLKPVAVGPTGSAVAAAGAVMAHDDTPNSGGAFSVQGTPTVAEQRACLLDTSTSPLLWSNPSSATAAEAEAVGCPFVRQAQQKHHHQQQRRQALLLPRHSNSDASSTKHLWRICCFCSCFDPSKLKLSTIQAYTQQQLPWQPLVALFLLSSWVVASDTGKATLACGSLRYWAVVLSVVPPCLMVTLFVRQWLLARTEVEAAAAAAVGTAASREPAAEAAALSAAAAMTQQRKGGVIHWTPVNSIAYPLVCSLAGVFAGLFGVGGGIVKGPLMLELGVLPDVAAATSATMICFTSLSACVVYLNFGGIVMDYAQALLLLGFVVTLIGQMVSTHLVKVLRRRSIIVFAMGLLMLLASIAAVYQMGLSTWAAHEHPPMWKWGSICQHS